jgi:monoamine oxidase
MSSTPAPAPTSTLTRRRFLAASAAAAGAASAGMLLPGCGGSGGGGTGRVVIVGAGLAGLIAAYELERDGIEVVLLEARKRPGGRVHTARNPFFRDQSAELGGEYIDASHRVLLGYIRRLGLDLDHLRGLGANLEGIVYADGRTRRYPEVATPEVQAEIDRFDNSVDGLAAPLDLKDPVARGSGLDRRSVADLIEELEIQGEARTLVERRLRDDYTVEPDRLSLLFHAFRAKLYARAPKSGTGAFRIDGGNERLLGALIDEIDAKVDFDAPVTSIDRRPDGVTVSVDGVREVDAAYCIVTAPLRLVSEIDFRPALPRPLAAAAAQLQYGAATKTPLQYRRRFWVSEGLNCDAITDLPIGTTWDATSAQSGLPGILMSYASGEEGRRFGRRPDSERIAAVAGQFERVFPDSRNRIQSGATAAWDEERFSRGSYAAYAPGQVTRFWRVLRRPVDRIYLAGEHCDSYTGYMEGAVRSGRRVARVVARRAR